MSFSGSIYHDAPVWLQNFLVSGYGYWLNYLRYSGSHRETLEALALSEHCDITEIRSLQTEQLKALISNAARHVPHYRNHPSFPSEIHSLGDLTGIPRLTKEDIWSQGESFISEQWIGTRSRLRKIHTGGTTGTPLTIYCDANTLRRNYAFFARFKRWAGVPEGGTVVTFAGRRLLGAHDHHPFWRRNRAANTWLFSSFHISPDTIPDYVDALARIAPDLIDAYPSSIEPIARYVAERGISTVKPSAVITSSETLREDVREIIEGAFGCKVFDHYGAAEMVAFITQCREGWYHANPEFGIVELLYNGQPVQPGESGQIVATGFINPVMPLIRYETGDRAVRGPDGPCECGLSFPRYLRIEGRDDEVIVTPEGRRIGRIDPIFKVLETPFEVQVIQDAPDHLTVQFASEIDLPSNERRAFLDELKGRVGSSMRIGMERVSRIPRTKSGKLRTVVNLVNGEEDRGSPEAERLNTRGKRGHEPSEPGASDC